jgi:hypothetical protein
MLHALSTANLARALAVAYSFCISVTQGEARGQTTVFIVHGTNRPVSVGMATTNGCIGMYPEDVAALFKLVDVGTPVRLINGPGQRP